MESDKGKNEFIDPFHNTTNVSADLPSALPPQLNNESLRAVSQHIIGFTQADAEKCIEQLLMQAMHNLKEGKFNQALSINQGLAIDEQINIPHPPQIQKPQIQHIFVKKNRQKQYDHKIALKWRQIIKKFINQQMKKELMILQATKQQNRQIIISLLCKKEYYFHTKPLYQSIAQKLKQMFQKLLQQKRCQQTDCLPLLQIIDNKFTRLKTIHIQYQGKIKNQILGSFENQPIYSIKALKFFKIIHDNKFLTQVTIRGVQILSFQPFIEDIYQLAHGHKTILKEYLWMNNFAPSKSLKLAIYTEIYFRFDKQNEDQILSQIKQLAFFHSFFSQLSQIKAIVELPHLKLSQNYGFPEEVVYINDLRILNTLWKCLRKIKKLKLSIESIFKENLIGNKQIQFIRSNLFGGLASFTSIAQLSFKFFQFSSKLSKNDFLAMEQSLTTLFQNNTVTHLKLSNCSNFPILPKITTLLSINLQTNNFRKNTNFLNSVVKSSSSLRSILCFLVHDYVRINQHLFNQLQILYIKDSSIYTETTSQLPSNLKLLDIWLNKKDLLAKMLKLTHITQLHLYGSLKHELLRTIPSPYLQGLHINNNITITNYDLQVIYQKWPSLNRLTFNNCKALEIDAKTILKFNQLNLLKAKKNNFRERKDIFYLLNQGIEVVIDWL